jgi:hypothetical protein
LNIILIIYHINRKKLYILLVVSVSIFSINLRQFSKYIKSEPPRHRYLNHGKNKLQRRDGIISA